MRILVDTNVLIPLAEEELKPLSPALRDCISDPRSLLYVSVGEPLGNRHEVTYRKA